MSPRRLHQFKDRLLTVLIVSAGCGAAVLGYLQERERLLGEVLARTRHSAVAFQSAELAALTGTRADLPGAAYAAVQARLQRFQATDRQVRGLRIFRYLPASGRTLVLADPAPGGARPGDPYAAAGTSPSLPTRLRTGEAGVDGPGDSELAAVVAAYAPIGPKPPPGAPRDFLAIDEEIPRWPLALALAAAGPAVFVWVVLGLPLVGYLLARRAREQGEAIRNLSAAVEQSRSAIMIIDPQGHIEYANHGLCEQLGHAHHDLIGRPWLNFQVADAAAGTGAELVAAVQAGRPWAGEWLNRRRDGSLYPVRGAFTPVRRRSGRLACCLATIEDRSEHQRTEEALRDSQERAGAGETAKSHFLATMSHEVRTPLNGIIGFTSLLLDTPLTPEQREFVQTIQLSSEALIQLTGDILDYARIEAGKLQLEPQPCAPRECVEEALDLAAAQAAAKGLELLHWVDEAVPAVISADGNRLRQVLGNLLGNAVKFTPAGEVEVRVTVERSPLGVTTGPTQLVFAVRDTGIGIAAAEHAKLFQPFTQLDQALTRRHGGSGLGLAIAKNIVELMGGRISLQSEPERGSTFSFTLPVRPGPGVAERKPLPPLAHLRLALAAPEGPVRAELVRLGERFGAELVPTTPDLLAATPGWDVALMELDAARVAELVAEPHPSPDLPPERVFGLVPLAMPSVTRAALRAHFRMLLSKPLHQDALHALLAAMVDTPVAIQPRRETAGLKVLLVEDDPVNRLLMQKQLTALGCRWTKAENGRVAVQELTRQSFDLVLMDLYMPELDGVAAIGQIRAGLAGEEMQDVWIAALTADARSDQKERTLEIGANDYLVKPVSLPELRVALEKFALARRRRG